MMASSAVSTPSAVTSVQIGTAASGDRPAGPP
jgi:hypothetical protein